MPTDVAFDLKDENWVAIINDGSIRSNFSTNISE